MTGGRRRLHVHTFVVLCLGLVLTLSLSVGPRSAAADPPVAPRSGSFVIDGTGYGHGWGMSQYGAYGAATQGRTWREILAFYYPGTTLAAQPGRVIDVWISVDDELDLQVQPAAGLRLSSGSASYVLPTGAAYRTWRVTRSGAGYLLSYRGASGGWTTQPTPLGTATWVFSNPASVVTVVLPGGAFREYRGTMSFVKRDAGGRTVNRVGMESYLRSVVPSEMPTSWDPDAVRAQAVAARSYAARLMDTSTAEGYDICDTVNCQVYSGLATTTGSARVVRETAGGDAAVQATANVVVTYAGAAAFTQFSSSNGGASAQGSQPYLRAGNDPYDGVIRNQSWRATLTAASIAQVWPSVGTVLRLQVTDRDGTGRWGGRVELMAIIGTARTVTVTGGQFRSAFGLRSTLFTVTGTPVVTPIPPGRPYATFPRSYNSTSRVDLTLLTRYGTLVRHPFSGGRLGPAVKLANPDFGVFTHVVNAGDWNGDGYQDVIARTQTSRLLLFRGNSSGRLLPGIDMGLNSDHRMLTSLGDVNGDRFPDLAMVTLTNRLFVVYGDGRTGRLPARAIGGSWVDRDWLRGPGDFTGDGRPDILSRAGDVLRLHRGVPGGFAPPTSLGGGWGAISTITAVGDVDGDGRPDVVARTRGGGLRLYRGDGSRLLAPQTIAGSFTGTRFAI